MSDGLGLAVETIDESIEVYLGLKDEFFYPLLVEHEILVLIVAFGTGTQTSSVFPHRYGMNTVFGLNADHEHFILRGDP